MVKRRLVWRVKSLRTMSTSRFSLCHPNKATRWIDARQVIQLATAGPRLKPLRPGIQRLRRIAGLDFVIALLQPRVNEIAGHVCDGGIAAVFDEHHRRCELPQ